MTGYTITYDGVASTTMPAFLCHTVQRKLVAEVRDQFVPMAGMEGAWHFPEKRGLKTLVVSASILSNTFPIERRDILEDVADWADKTAFKKFICSDQPDRYDMAVLCESPDIEEWREKGTFALTFYAHPYSYKIAVDTQVNVINAASLWTYALDTLCKVNTYPIIQIQPLGGNLSGFIIQNSGRTLVYNQAVVDSSFLTISSLGYTVNTGPNTDIDLQAVIDHGTLSMLNISGQFPILGAGANSIAIIPSVGSTATSISVNTFWRRRYRS